MKIVKKEVELILESIERPAYSGCELITRQVEYTYTFKTYKFIPNIESLTAFVEVEEPENIKEFREEKGLTKEQLIEWLNKNYKE